MKMHFITRTNRWRAIAYPRASAIGYLPAHQNSKCVPAVLIYRAIACDSFKILAQKAQEELCDNPTPPPPPQKKKNRSYFFTSGDPQVTPRHAPPAPRANVLHQCILLIIFNLTCNMSMFVQNRFWTLRGHTTPPPLCKNRFWTLRGHPHPPPEGLYQNFECVPPVHIHRTIDCESFEILA